jgi:ADP-dependent NAD(P)H-hydrate dehydratase / NAD(P)H-hydrate epimerase
MPCAPSDHPPDPLPLPAADTTPLHDLAATRRIESRALARAAPPLMQRAGAAAARLGLAVAPHARRVWVACGPGNNGGDGLVAAAALADGHREVYVTFDGAVDRLSPEAREAFERVAHTLARRVDEPPALGPDDLAIDACLGIGATRAPEGILADRIEVLRRLPAAVLALDVPSGLDADTGRAFGASAVRARHTLTFLTAKPGLFTASGRDHAGRVWLDRLGVDDPELPQAWLGTRPAARAISRAHDSHKGRFGDVRIIGGAPGMAGAAVLAAQAALASGAGRVLVSFLDASIGATSLVHRPELMWRPLPGPDDRAAWDDGVVAIGCGGGDAVAAVLAPALRRARSLVVDADALNAIAADSALQRSLQARHARGHPTVLTPHPLEAARLMGSDAPSIQAHRLRAAQALAERFQCIVVLKGSGSVVTAPGTLPWINATGSGALATAGTGDVLAGWIAGRWAGAGPAAKDLRDRLELVRDAVALHGEAGEGWGAAPARAGELVEAMHRLAITVSG